MLNIYEPVGAEQDDILNIGSGKDVDLVFSILSCNYLNSKGAFSHVL